jgi:acetylornithine deacetylase/succinyl-diaminopimelate desuccinylase-like protein
VKHITICASSLAGLLLGLTAGSLAQKVQFVPVNKREILERVENVPGTDAERAAKIRELFARAGCNGRLLREQPVEGLAIPNVICHLHGQESGTVIVGAHYDRATVARPIDDWSGASLLPALYESLRAKKRHHSYIFVAFADHAQLMAGSKFFAEHLSSAEAAHAEAMVNLDALGLSPTKVWSARSDKDLVHDLLTMVYTLKLPASQIDLAPGGGTDADFFANRKIPSITIHSLTQQNLIDDAATSFRPNNYYDTYRLLCGYLAYLDVILKPRPS